MQALAFNPSRAPPRGNGLPHSRSSKSRGGLAGNKKRRRVGTATILFALLLAFVPTANILLRLHPSASNDGKGETDGTNGGEWAENVLLQSEEDSLPQQGLYDRQVSAPEEDEECDSAVSKDPPPVEDSPPVAELQPPPKVAVETKDRKKEPFVVDIHEKDKSGFGHKKVFAPPEGSVLAAAHHNTTKSTFVKRKSRYPTPWVEYGGQGGKVSDGRNRCFVDDQGDCRCYPTVFFFGTSKCGTTSLARWLARHPLINWVANPRRPTEIEDTGVKEAHVFDDSPKGTREEMEKLHHEKLFKTSPKATSQEVIIDYSPHYIAVAEVPHRIADLYGPRAGLKFVVTLREPVSRTISSWEFKNMFNSKKQRPEELRPLSDAVKEGKKRASKLEECITKANARRASSRERDLQMCNPRNFLELPLYVSHVGKSMYAQQLERWFDIFGRENFKVVFTDDMAADPVRVLEEVMTFLDLDFASEEGSKSALPTRSKWAWITTMAYNKTKSAKKSELQDQVTDKIKAELKEFFKPHNRRLEKLLGVPVPDSWN